MSTKKLLQKAEVAKSATGQEFLYRPTYKNNLEIIPFPPKLMPLLTIDQLLKKTDSFVEIHVPEEDHFFAGNILEYGFCEARLYNTNVETPLNPLDQELLAVPVDANVQVFSNARPIVPWLRRTEYISAEYKQYGKIKKDKPANEKAVHGNRIDDFGNQLDQIDKSFEFAKISGRNLKHPTNPNLKPKEILPIFPDFEYIANQANYFLGIYAEDPLGAEGDHNRTIKLEEAILKSKEINRLSYGYYVPTAESVNAIQDMRLTGNVDDIDINEYKYELKRELAVPHLADPSEQYFLEVRTDDHGAFYSKIAFETKFNKKRAAKKGSKTPQEEIEKLPQTLGVRQREFNADEEESRKKSDVYQ